MEFWKRLFYRWFVQYNPVYLVSAALVLRGVNLISTETLHARHGEFIGPAVAEVYAWMLIAGAAYLFRVGSRRPAVMLALIALVYQGDVTLHTETCALLGAAGWMGSFAWLASFALKLAALGRALRLRVSRSAYAVAALGGAGLALVPHLLRALSAHDASLLIGAWLFALSMLALHTSRRVEAAIALDDWGETVLRRSLVATWSIWAALLVFHVAFWFSSRELEAGVLLPAALAPLARFFRRDRRVWAYLAALFVLTLNVAPEHAPFAAQVSALAFLAHGVRALVRHEIVWPAMVGALTSVHLAAWLALGTSAHVLPLDLAYALALGVCAWRLRAKVALLPLAVLAPHHLIQARILTAPVATLEWGVWLTTLGFLALMGGIVTSARAALSSPPADET